MPYITVRTRKIYYEKHGTGKPVLFGHSFLWSKSMWQYQIPLLKERFCCIIPDLWGHGASDVLPEGECTIEQIAQEYKEFMDELSIDHYAVVGLSIGGMWATHLALQYPGKVTQLVLMDSYLGAEPQEKKQLYYGMIDIIEKCNAIPGELIEKIIPLFLSPVTLKTNPNLVDGFRNDLANISTTNIPTLIAIAKSIFERKSVLSQLENIKIPTKIIVGSDDISRPVYESKEMTSLIPNSQLHIIKDAGHICNMEQPDEVNKILYNFLTGWNYENLEIA